MNLEEFILSVLAGIVASYIFQWLNTQKKA